MCLETDDSEAALEGALRWFYGGTPPAEPAADDAAAPSPRETSSTEGQG